MRFIAATMWSLLAACDGGPIEGHLRQATSELRPTDTTSGLMWRFAQGDVVMAFDSAGGEFKVHYTSAGPHAVPGADTNGNGVPDFVELVAQTYDAVSRRFHGDLGFRRPVSDESLMANGGDGRFDVYLLDFARAADGAFRVDTCTNTNRSVCQGYLVQENDFAGYGYPSLREAVRILASHEYFHSIQAAYDNEQGVVWSEASAVWATEAFDASTTDLDGYVAGYLERTDRSLDSAPVGPVPRFAYGASLWPQFLTERYDAGVVRAIWESLEDGRGVPSEPGNQSNPSWLVQTDAVLRRDFSSSFADAFVTFSEWNLRLGGSAPADGGYAGGRGYAEAVRTPIALPFQSAQQRLFYASMQVLEASAAGRAEVTAQLVDDPRVEGDETEGLVLRLAVRRAGRTLAPQPVLLPQPGDAVVVAVINTARGASGAVLSKRPGLCVGTPSEVAQCRAVLRGEAPDAGAMPSVDAGVAVEGPGVTSALGRSNEGCQTASGLTLLGVILFVNRLRSVQGRRRCVDAERLR